MRLTVRLCIFCIFITFTLCDMGGTSNKRKGKHFLMLLGYLHGYKVGQDIALKYPSYLVSPVFIMPTINQQQSVDIKSGSNDENYQENAGTVQVITLAKLVDNTTYLSNDENSSDIDDIEVNLGNSKKPLSENITENQNVSTSTTSKENLQVNDDIKVTEIEPETLSTSATIEATTLKATTISSGQYPTPLYNNSNINSLTITAAPNEDLALPPVADNRWRNFSLRANLSDLADGKETLIDEQLNNTLSISTTEIVTEYPVGTTITISNNGKYPNALYNNAVIDQLSITTNSYTNQGVYSPPLYYDRWATFSSSPDEAFLRPNSFKPLAGLYYDGFLHKPLKKYTFITKSYV